MKDIVAVDYQNSDLKDDACVLAHRLGLNVTRDAESCLYLTPEKLCLKLAEFSLLAPDFSAAAWMKRKLQGKKQGIVKACKPHAGIQIIDATAGWGRDSAVLASFGAHVLMLERNPIMAALLEDALRRRPEQLLNLSLEQIDACSYFESLSVNEYPDVIYIDPMHPSRTKSALVKKDLQALQQLIGPDDDALELLSCAINHCKQRVVVKWPQKKQALLKPDLSVEGKTVRFDVYFARG